MTVAYMTIAQVADELSVHRDTVRRWIADGELRAYRDKLKNGWPYRVSRDDFNAFVTKRRGF